MNNNKLTHLVCFSGGHSSALVAIEVVRHFGKEHVVLLNHDIHPDSEEQDVKRFKKEVADYLGLPITYANHPQWDKMDQFDVVIQAKAFKVGSGSELCTSRLKTEPFMKYLAEHHADKNCVIYYGFDANERARIQRRSGILGAMGYRSDYPLAIWADRTIHDTRAIGIEPPMQYGSFKHANCIGCLKARKLHWYVVYCTRPDRWEKAKQAEDAIGYSIISDTYLEELEPEFARLTAAGVPASEHISANLFFAKADKILSQPGLFEQDEDAKPCECVF